MKDFFLKMKVAHEEFCFGKNSIHCWDNLSNAIYVEGLFLAFPIFKGFKETSQKRNVITQTMLQRKFFETEKKLQSHVAFAFADETE